MSRAKQIASLPTAPAFSAFCNSNQPLTTGVFTKVQCNAEEFDTAGAFDTSTYRFTPQVPGYYQVNAGVLVYGTSLSLGILMIYKNGGLWKRGNDIRATFSGFLSMQAHGLISMNGSTDYLELYTYAEGSNLQLYGTTATDNYFQAALVRPA